MENIHSISLENHEHDILVGIYFYSMHISFQVGKSSEGNIHDWNTSCSQKRIKDLTKTLNKMKGYWRTGDWLWKAFTEPLPCTFPIIFRIALLGWKGVIVTKTVTTDIPMTFCIYSPHSVPGYCFHFTDKWKRGAKAYPTTQGQTASSRPTWDSSSGLVGNRSYALSTPTFYLLAHWRCWTCVCWNILSQLQLLKEFQDYIEIYMLLRTNLKIV